MRYHLGVTEKTGTGLLIAAVQSFWWQDQFLALTSAISAFTMQGVTLNWRWYCVKAQK